MTRKINTMKGVCFAALVCLSGLFALSVKAEKTTTQPNFIYILTDDQGYGDLERHGHPYLKTPNLNRLHDESVRFDNFYVSPSCSPTRAALLTGRHEFRSGVTHTLIPREQMNMNSVTLVDVLSQNGYETGFIGKWHIGHTAEYAPNKRGFTWCSTNQKGPLQHFDVEMVRNNKRFPTKGYREDVYFDEAMVFMEESKAKEKPFFLYLSTYSPHTPLDAPEEFIAPFRGEVSEKQAKYLGMIENIDYNVGRLYEYLEEKGMDENTIVIFMNDNGVTEGLDVYNANMRGPKATAWEGGCRAMSFWRWPNKWKPRTIQNLSAHLDLFPTVCSLAGVEAAPEVKQKLEGFDLSPILESDSDTVSWHDERMLFHHVARWPSGLAAQHKYAMCGVRQGEYLMLRSNPCSLDSKSECAKYTSQCSTMRSVADGLKGTTYTLENAGYHWGVSRQGHWSLFNVKKDPGNLNNLAIVKPELVAKLDAAYSAWWDGMYPEMIAAGGDDGEPVLLGEKLNLYGPQKKTKKPVTK